MMTTSNEHNNAPAVPQGYEIHEIPADYSGLVWLEGQVRAVARRDQAATGPQGWTDADSDAARLALELECLLMDTKDLSVVSKWWGSANDALELHRQRLAATPAPAPAQGKPFGYFRAEPFGWTDCSEDAEGAIALYEHPAHEKHWTENEPVRLPSARTDRVYLAGPMTGIAELNFPAFNQEAERLRAEGLQVLNPADHGIVDGADWADYLRHDIAGLSSCERIHLLRGWTKSKGACLEMTIAKALGMTVTYQVDAEIEHNNAPAVPSVQQGWVEQMLTDLRHVFDAGGAETPQETRDVIEYVASWIAAYRDNLAATPAPAPAQEVGLTDELEQLGHIANGIRICGVHDKRFVAQRIDDIIAALRAKGGK
jgi:hypothetical protein